MEAWIEFGRGPLFRLTFGLMVLGLLRIFALTLWGLHEAYHSNPDKIINWRELFRQAIGWLIPIGRLCRKRPIYSLVSFLFHIGLILVPLFYSAHVLLWKRSVGISWFDLPQGLADLLTVLTIVTGIGLFLGRVFHRGARSISRGQDVLWPPLLVIPFITGFICANGDVVPATYQFLMLLHVYSADLIMVMIPFTKVAHCVLMPLSQFVTGLGWKFRCGAGDQVIDTLGYHERPTWVEKPRLGSNPPREG